jgi:hypothetical protein
MVFVENRNDPRRPLRLPVDLGGGVHGIAQDISPSGMYVVVRGDFDPGSRRDFAIEIEEPPMKFTAQGIVVRVDRRKGYTGIAVRLESPRLARTD